MNTNKFLLAGVVAGIAFFFAGWVVYGMLLMDFMKNHSTPAAQALNKTEMVWWALIAGNLITGLFYAYIFEKWAKIRTLTGGAIAGATIGFFIAVYMDLQFYAMYNMMEGLIAYVVDVVAATVMSAITGGVAGFMLGFNRTE